MSDRGVLLLLCFLTCTFVLSLRIGGDSILWRECPLGTHMDVSWLGDCSAKSRLLPSCVTESKLLMMLHSMLLLVMDLKQWPLPLFVWQQGGV